jgi:hypothetical protein
MAADQPQYVIRDPYRTGTCQGFDRFRNSGIDTPDFNGSMVRYMRYRRPAYEEQDLREF